MTSSHLATLVSLFIILVGATYLVANPDGVLAADRGTKLVPHAVDPAGKPLPIVQAERTQKQTASQKRSGSRRSSGDPVPRDPGTRGRYASGGKFLAGDASGHGIRRA